MTAPTTPTPMPSEVHLMWMGQLAEATWGLRNVPIAELINHPDTNDTGREMLLGLSFAYSAIADQFGPDRPTAAQP